MKHAKNLSKLLTLFALSACAQGGSGPDVGHFAKPSPTAAKLRSCAETKLASPAPFIGDEIAVCRRDTDGKVGPKKIKPSFYVSGRGKRVHVAQVVGVTLSYVGATPPKDIANVFENEVNDFLTVNCGPKFSSIFHRSGLHGRIVFQTFLETDRLAGRSSAIGGTIGDREELFGEGQKSPVTLNNAKKEIGVDRTRISPNVRLELVVGADEGVSLKDALVPVTSGPLKKVGNQDQQNRFCAQLLVRVGENLGLGQLTADDKTCVEPGPTEAAATVDSSDAKDTKDTKASATTVEPVKPVGPSGLVGIMKAGSAAPAELATIKLAPTEIETILSPICGSFEPLPKGSKTSQK